MTIKFAKATASDEGRSAVFAGNETRAAAEAYTARWFFRKRTLCIVGLVAGFLAINALSGAYVDFDFMEAAADIPGGLAWMAVNFLPSAASLEKLPQIMPALLSTVLDSIAASTTAALLAYVVAVLGSRWWDSAAWRRFWRAVSHRCSVTFPLLPGLLSFCSRSIKASSPAFWRCS